MAAIGSLATYHKKPLQYPPGGPSSIEEFREKYPYNPKTFDRHRRVVTIHPSRNDLDDVSAAFDEGLRNANHGGTLYLPTNETFVIGKPLDLTFLTMSNYPFQSSRMFWKWGGKNVKIYGEGTIDGNGQEWWNEIGANDVGKRPVLFYGQNLSNFAMEGISLKDSPMWNQLYVTSKDISLHNLVCTAVTNNASAYPRNTDFFDSVNVNNLDVKNIWVNIGDDCFSPKTNTTNIHVDTMYCNGTHGQSMGSIGEYSGEMSIIENVLIENIWIMNGANGARLKTWAGPNIGYGYMNNITFRNFWQANNDIAVQLDSCYFGVNATECAKYPSQVNITNITLENFHGTVDGQYGRNIARLTCSSNPNAVCENIKFVNWNVTSVCGGPPIVICDNVEGGLRIPCYNSTSPEAIAALADTC